MLSCPCPVLQVWIVLPAALKFLVNPFDILITVCFVFGGCSVFGVGMITYRNGYTRRASLLRSFLDQLVNAPIMLLFFSHVLWHLTVVCFRCVVRVGVLYGYLVH